MLHHFYIREILFACRITGRAHALFRNSNKFPATDVCPHVMSYSTGCFPFQNIAVPTRIAARESHKGNSVFQHALRGPLFVSAYHPALTCPDSLWVPLTFYFRIIGLLIFNLVY